MQDDFDKDGLVNLLEFAFNTNPKAGAHARYPLVTRNTVAGTVTVSYPKSAASTGYQIKRSSDLAGWSSVPMENEILNAGTGLYETTFPWNASSDSSLFIIFKISELAQP